MGEYIKQKTGDGERKLDGPEKERTVKIGGRTCAPQLPALFSFGQNNWLGLTWDLDRSKSTEGSWVDVSHRGVAKQVRQPQEPPNCGQCRSSQPSPQVRYEHWFRLHAGK